MSNNTNEAFDAIRENVLQTAQEHYTENSSERTAFIAGAGYVLSQHTAIMNPAALKHDKSVHLEPAEVRQYTADSEDEIGEWIAATVDNLLSVVIIGDTLHIGDQQAEYGDFIERSVYNEFTVHKQTD